MLSNQFLLKTSNFYRLFSQENKNFRSQNASIIDVMRRSHYAKTHRARATTVKKKKKYSEYFESEYFESSE